MMLSTYVSLSPPSLLLLVVVAFAAVAARVSQLDPLRSGSNLGSVLMRQDDLQHVHAEAAA